MGIAKSERAPTIGLSVPIAARQQTKFCERIEKDDDGSPLGSNPSSDDVGQALLSLKTAQRPQAETCAPPRRGFSSPKVRKGPGDFGTQPMQKKTGPGRTIPANEPGFADGRRRAA